MVRTGAERAVCEDLTLCGVETYFPSYLRWRTLPKHQRSKAASNRIPVVSPLFSGYVFGFVAEEQEVSAIMSTKGVYGIVRTEADILFVPEAVIDRIKAAEQSGDYNEIIQSRGAFLNSLLGKQIEIQEGPMKGRKGTVTGVAGTDLKVECGRRTLRVSGDHIGLN